jgi:hypothetical protein
VVTAFVTCPDDMAKDVAVTFHEAVELVFLRYRLQSVDSMAH